MSPRKADDYIQTAQITALHTGDSGSGKSIASCSAILRPTYVLDCEDRMASVISYYRKLHGHVNGLEYDTFSMGNGYFPLKSRLDALKQSCPYKTVVVATLTSYVDIVLEHLRSTDKGSRASGATAGKKIAGIQVNELEDYNAETAAIVFDLLQTLKFLQKMGKNVILEAHLLTHEAQRAGRIEIVRPLITGGKKAASKIPGYFNETFYFFNDQDMSGNIKFKVQTRATGQVFAKTSFQELPNEMEWTNQDYYAELVKKLPQTVVSAEPKPDESTKSAW
jgi:hypothetical protein